MIKRKDGLWLICYEKSGEYIEGSGYFKSSTEAYAAEASVLEKHPEPVQQMNRSSKVEEPVKVATSLRGGKR